MTSAESMSLQLIYSGQTNQSIAGSLTQHSSSDRSYENLIVNFRKLNQLGPALNLDRHKKEPTR